MRSRCGDGRAALTTEARRPRVRGSATARRTRPVDCLDKLVEYGIGGDHLFAGHVVQQFSTNKPQNFGLGALVRPTPLRRECRVEHPSVTETHLLGEKAATVHEIDDARDPARGE